MGTFAPMNNIDEKKTGLYFLAQVGPYKGKIGEAVTFLSWGGVRVMFEDGKVITYDASDLEKTQCPAPKAQ